MYTSEAIASGGTLDTLCGDVNPAYTGIVTLTCSLGTLAVTSSSCVAVPCEPWHFATATLHGSSGIVFPSAQITSGNSGTADCGRANIEYSGDIVINCVSGSIVVGDTSACMRTCSTYGSNSPITIDGEATTVSPAARIAHGASAVQQCGEALYGYSGPIGLSCDDSSLSVDSQDRKPPKSAPLP